MTSWNIWNFGWEWKWEWRWIGREVPHEKKGLQYVDRLDELLSLVFKIAGSKRRYFHLAPEFPDGDRYWECINAS